MSEVERLIKAVQATPCLWDSNDKDYTDRDVRDSAWEQVCKKVSTDWEEFDAPMFNTACEILKKKWTHIRDYYRRDLYRMRKKRASGIKAETKYRYAPMLHFLKPFYEEHANSSQSENESETEQSFKDQDIKNEVQEDIEIKLSPNHNEDSDGSLQSVLPKKRPKRKCNQSRRLWTPQQAITPKSEQKSPSYEDADDDEKFLLSFRNNMKRMNSSQKLDFKIGMLQLLKVVSSDEDVVLESP